MFIEIELECTSRDQELVGIKKLQQISLDPSGNLKIWSTESSVKADLSSDMKVREAFMCWGGRKGKREEKNEEEDEEKEEREEERGRRRR